MGIDLSGLDLNVLRQIAHRTNRVEKNLNHESPRILHAVKSIPFSSMHERASIVTVVPGTGLVILHNSQRQLICCDIENSLPVAKIDIGHIKAHTSYDERGRHLLALIADKRSNK